MKTKLTFIELTVVEKILIAVYTSLKVVPKKIGFSSKNLKVFLTARELGILEGILLKCYENKKAE